VLAAPATAVDESASCARYRIENCIGMLKLIDVRFSSGGIGGNGSARRIIARVSLSSEG
jgi:hypothetical protein